VLHVTYALTGGMLVTAVDHKAKRVPGEQLARVRWLRAVLVIEPQDAPEALAALSERYPAYRDRPPAGPVLRLQPERLLWWWA
jgi:hypothetical protein